MRYPGEWVFPGGSREEGDAGPVETAIREFREELRYDGEISDTRLLRSVTLDSRGRSFHVEFYAARIGTGPPLEVFDVRDGGEVIAARWFAPADALALIRSDEFTAEQLDEFRTRGLGDHRFGPYAVTARQVPVENVRTLELIRSMPELEGQY